MTNPRPPLPDYGNYPYISDAGQSSIAGMTELVRSSGVDFRIGSAYRPGDPLWHGQQNAIDIFASTQGMNQIAAYLFQYAEYLLELIHCADIQTGEGWYVDNGIAYNRFSEKTMREHVNHVHLAMTNSALRAAAQATKRRIKGYRPEDGKTPAQHTVLNALGNTAYSSDQAQPSTGKGCLKPAAAAMFVACALPASIIIPLFM